MINDTLKERLWKRAIYHSNGCIEYGGYIDRTNGYGLISNNPHDPIRTHRASWIIENGKISSEEVVRHKCDNRKCFNPEHLEIGTHYDNVRGMHDRGRFDNYKERIELCPQMHKYSSVDHEGYRSCRICRGVQARKSGARRRAKLGKTDLASYCDGCWYLSANCNCDELGSFRVDSVRYIYKEGRI